MAILYHHGVLSRSNITIESTGWLNLIRVLFCKQTYKPNSNHSLCEQSVTIYTPQLISHFS